MSTYHQVTRHYCILTLVFLQVSCTNARANRPSHSNILDAQDSFVQYPSDVGSIIIAKPLDQSQGSDPAFEDFLHVIVACSLALVLATLLGLVIRHYGLTLPPLFERPVAHYPQDADARNRPQMEVNEAGSGLGFNVLEKERGSSDDTVKPPPAAYLKWC
jgi:hypothetical protein